MKKTAAQAFVDSHRDEGAAELFGITELCREFGITLRALRFYEDKGLINPVRQGTTRLYTPRDRARLKLILLGRKVGFSLREVKQMLDLHDPAGTNMKQFRVVLDKSERQMGKLERQKRALDEAISDLQGLITTIRGRMETRQAANQR